jgi:rubrerythrin
MLKMKKDETGEYKIVSKKPINMSKVSDSNTDKQILRVVMMSELDTINLYEQMCANTENQEVKDVLDYIIAEEKEHFEKAEELLETIEGEVEEEE